MSVKWRSSNELGIERGCTRVEMPVRQVQAVFPAELHDHRPGGASHWSVHRN
jgi:hypothetical protein